MQKAKIKNIILKMVTYAAGYFLISGICGFDGSQPVACMCLVIVSGIWLTVFSAANGVFSW